MIPTRFKFLWRPRSKTRAMLRGRPFAIQMGTYVDSDSQSLIIERTVVVNMRKTVPLVIVTLGLVYLAGATVLQKWLQERSSTTVAWNDCLLAPIRYNKLKAGLRRTPAAVEPAIPVRRVTTVADNVITSNRNRIETVENEDVFFQRLAANTKAGNNDDILSDLNLARSRSPKWFPSRQAELTQLAISICLRNGDLLAMRGAASDYLNGNEDRATIIINVAQKLHGEKFSDAAIALIEEVRRKNPNYQLPNDLLEKWSPPPIPAQHSAPATTPKSAP